MYYKVKCFCLTLCYIVIFFCENALAYEPYLIKKIEDYLNTLVTMRADFTQSSSEQDEIKHGVFYLQKPGRIKLDYLSPRKITVISNNHDISYYDHEMRELSHVKNEHALAELLAQDKISFAKTCNILSLSTKNNEIEIMLNKKEKREDNDGYPYLIMKFTEKPKMQLKSFYVVSDASSMSEVNLANVTINTQLPSDTFTFKDPSFFSTQEE